jgi:DNA repair exonuclease SbcCD ATPase subunit
MIAKQFASPLKYLLDSCKVDNKDSVAATSDTAILKQELDSNISLINELRASLSQAHDEYTALNKKTISLQNSLTEMEKKQSSNTYLEQLEEAKGHNLEYKNRIAALEAKLAVKETTIATLTQQIEKMANDNLMKLVQENTGSPWQECVDENGNVYYYNSETNESSWEKP